MTTEHRDRLKQIQTFPSLIKYLREELDWPIHTDDFEELTYDYTADELGIDEKNAARIEENGIKRLRPLVPNQPWGIFFVRFEPKRLPVVALRRILSRVVTKKRASASSEERRAWAVEDLLFVSNYGEGDKRQITFAHFSTPQDGQNLPTLKVLGWDNLNTPLHLDGVAENLTRHLTWPDNVDDVDAWREHWRGAFTLRHREVITTARDLSIRLAELARAIRDLILMTIDIENEKGPLTRLMKAFQEALVHDLDASGFADMYAQTIAYGLLSARISDPHRKSADDLASQMRTNPFLRELMETFLQIGGRRGKAGGPGIDFDELGVGEVVELLDDANMEAVLRDFGDRNPQEDPVIHFYEHFLSAYDREQKVRRGVFYTPRPVVSYIVRSVDELLRTEFGLEDGLADTMTWGEMAKLHNNLKVPDGVSPGQPFVQILDPATGTGTFLVEVIDTIYRTMRAKWEREAGGPVFADVQGRWNDYVPKHLLPRLHGYELLMAPYAIAHLKIGLKLYETGYRFDSDERARIYLTNSLEPATDMQQMELEGFLPALAHEAQQVNEIKRTQPFTVVIGNPPYSSSISEPDWLMTLLMDWKHGLNETKSDLNREEWKFLRFGQYLCATSHQGVVGFIINRDFLDGITKRRMREHLGETFPLRVVVDLNGDVKGNIADENVFEIEQGVTIALLCTRHQQPQVRFSSRVGTRDEKYRDLISKSPIDRDLVELQPVPPYFRWLPFTDNTSASTANEYAVFLPMNEAFNVYSSGIQTKRDSLCVAFDREELWARVNRLHSLSVEAARDDFNLGEDGRDWGVALAKADVASSGPNDRYISPLLYRPFDVRFTYWTGHTKGFLAYPRRDVMQHVIGHQNVGMIFNRQIVGDSVSHFGVSRLPICHGTFYLGNKGQDYFAPLSVFDSASLMADDRTGSSNLSPRLLSSIRARVGSLAVDEVKPETVFGYIYALVHCPTYRNRYAELIKLDFPRIPLSSGRDLFYRLAHLGSELVALHLMESPKLDHSITTYSGPKHPEVVRVGWSDDGVWLDAAATKKGQPAKPGTIGFHGVPEEVWNFHVGGYQVCEKWLKDRKGRRLSEDDIVHYQKIVVALNETIRIMAEIDEVIEKYGGWPGAFVTGDATNEANTYKADEDLARVADDDPSFGDT